MRSQVRILARFAFKTQFESRVSGFAFQVKITVNFLCKRATDTANLDQVVDASTTYPLQTPKLFQQFPATLRPQSRNFLETRCFSCFCTSLPMARYGEPMRFIPDLLNQVQRR